MDTEQDGDPAGETPTEADKGETPTSQPETGEAADEQAAKQRLQADLAKERRERKKAAETVERLRAALDGAQAEKQTTVTEAQAALAAAETKVLRLSVALDEGLPADLAKRLVGDDEDELRADAKALLALVRKPKSDAKAGSAPAPPNSTADPNSLLRAFTGAG